MKNFNVNKDGFYGDFGGAFIPEMLFPNIDELQKNYIKISESKKFKIGISYPNPIVDHQVAREKALNAFKKMIGYYKAL